MKLLVTGGLGFIGSNFILKLLTESNDYEIVNIDAELFVLITKTYLKLKIQKNIILRKVISQIKNLWKNILQIVMR